MSQLVTNIKENIDPFLDGPAWHIMTGAKIDEHLVIGLISSDESGEKRFSKFVKERMVIRDNNEERIDFFDPIPRQTWY